MQVQLTSSTYYSVELVQVQGFKIQTPRSIHQPIVFNLPCIILIVTGMGSPQLAIIRNHNNGKIFTGLNPAVQRLLACLDVWLLVRLSPSRCQIPLRCLDVFIGKPRRWTRTGFEGSSTWATELFTSQATSKLGVCHTPSRKLPYSHQHSTSEVMTEDRWKMKCTTDSKSFETNHVHERIKSETNDSRWTSSTFGMSAESCMHQVSNLGIISSLSAERERPHLSACQTKKTCQTRNAQNKLESLTSNILGMSLGPELECSTSFIAISSSERPKTLRNSVASSTLAVSILFTALGVLVVKGSENTHIGSSDEATDIWSLGRLQTATNDKISSCWRANNKKPLEAGFWNEKQWKSHGHVKSAQVHMF